MEFDREELKKIMSEIFEDRAKMDSELHHDHHKWLDERIQAEKDRRIMYHEITKSVIQYSVAGILGYLIWLFQRIGFTK